MTEVVLSFADFKAGLLFNLERKELKKQNFYQLFGTKEGTIL